MMITMMRFLNILAAWLESFSGQHVEWSILIDLFIVMSSLVSHQGVVLLAWPSHFFLLAGMDGHDGKLERGIITWNEQSGMPCVSTGLLACRDWGMKEFCCSLCILQFCMQRGHMITAINSSSIRPHHVWCAYLRDTKQSCWCVQRGQADGRRNHAVWWHTAGQLACGQAAPWWRRGWPAVAGCVMDGRMDGVLHATGAA
jgi:hypothetical protein